MPERLESVSVTANLLPMLGVHSALGRTFLLEQAQPGDNFVALLSDVLWKEKFGGDPNIPGKSVTLDKQSYTIIGVLPANFRFPDRRANPQIILPFKLPPAVDWSTKRLALTRGIGRLKPRLRLRQANGELVPPCPPARANIPAG